MDETPQYDGLVGCAHGTVGHTIQPRAPDRKRRQALWQGFLLGVLSCNRLVGAPHLGQSVLAQSSGAAIGPSGREGME
ncbi:hypothetical protein JK182_11835 [Acetobacter okinawensis]|uniref:hypothetical protein n=1 Tax=Acetobacter okinawensis TaxID=1076594 RepID=UPI001BAE1D6E|nr:hypothetical protein [Acetobacter okinawensis]MBS0989348.1 hypothetical protein [Acetobacter okinawensis]